MQQLGRVAPREGGGMSYVIARSEATKQSIFFRGTAMDCFAYARNDGLGSRRLKNESKIIPSRRSGSRVAAVRNP
jgi:hypothetical protein